MLIPRNRLAIVLLKVWRSFGNLLVFLRSKLQDVFDWLMNKLVVWLTRYYLGHGYPQY